MLRPMSFRPATHEEIALIAALARVSFPVGVGAKRLVRDLAAGIGEAGLKITPRQAHALTCIAWTYRRQLPPPLRPSKRPEPWTNPALTPVGDTPLAEDPSAGADAFKAALADPAERSI